MSSLKDIIGGFCQRINLPNPATVIPATAPTEQQYLSLFKKIGDNLRNRPYQWPQLKRGYTFDEFAPHRDSGNIRAVQLPGDFYRILESAEWDVTNQWPMRGPISDYNMAVRNFAVVSLQTRKAFNLAGPTQYLFSNAPYAQRSAGEFQITPIPVDGDQLFLGYLSCNWLWPQDWVASTLYTAGAIRAGDGQIYRTASGGTSGTTRPNWAAGTSTDGNIDWTVYREPYMPVTTNTNLSDNDLCLFDDDLMIDGMVWAFRQAKNQDFSALRGDWENQVKGAFARFNGPTRISMCEDLGEYFEWPNCPTGSWPI